MSPAELDTPTGDGVLLRMTGIVKEFPGVRALGGVDLNVRAGEVHCLIGQNGAGKSTLIKVLSGVHRPDAGDIVWQGEHVTFANPQAAMKAGIATIYQELDLVDGMSVAENVFLGHEPARLGFSRRRQARAAEGSSMMISRVSRESARAMLATCLAAGDSRPTSVPGRISACPSRSSRRRAARLASPRLTKPSRAGS